MTKKQDEVTLDTKLYAEIRPRLLAGMITANPDCDYPVLIREAEGNKPTGRWMVLDCTREGGHPMSWAWPPVASNPCRNAAAARFPGPEAPARA